MTAFRVGEIVNAVDSRDEIYAQKTVVSVGARCIRTNDGRVWARETGFWMEDGRTNLSYPFPRIVAITG